MQRGLVARTDNAALPNDDYPDLNVTHTTIQSTAKYGDLCFLASILLIILRHLCRRMATRRLATDFSAS